MATAERYAALLSQSGWAILTSELALEEDKLMALAQQYWGSLNAQRNPQAPGGGYTFVLNGPAYNMDGTITLAPVFQFVLNSMYGEIESLL